MTLNANGYGWAPETYTAFRTPSPPAADGSLGDDVWSRAPRTRRFVDMVTGEPAPLDTTASVVWDGSAVYVAFWAAEPTLTATLTERDSLLFYENDLEVFIDGGDCYYELEFNAIGTVYEAFYIWRDAYRPGSRWDVPRFDVHSPQTHSFGGDYVPGPTSFWTGNHPRGTRWAFLDYDLPGLDVAVGVDGVLNDPTYASRGWTACVTLPWSGLTDLAGDRSLPPQDGDTWGIFLGRFEQVAARDGSRVTAGWSAGAFGVADTHVPECFTRVVFDTTLL